MMSAFTEASSEFLSYDSEQVYFAANSLALPPCMIASIPVGAADSPKIDEASALMLFSDVSGG
jgi:hypothetical protein